MFCTICGCPILPQPPSEGGVEGRNQHPQFSNPVSAAALLREQQQASKPTPWLRQAVMLSDPAEEFETLELHYRAGKKPGVAELAFTRDVDDQEIRRDEVAANWPDECVLVEDGTRIRPSWGVGLDHGGQRHPNSTPYGIVVHAACLGLVEKVVRHKSRRRNPHVRSMRSLWKVLRMRLDACDNELMGRPDESMVVWADEPAQHAILWRRNLYYMHITPTSWWTDIWRNSWRDKHGEWLLEDPTTTPDLTSILLANVKPVEIQAVNQETEAFQKAFVGLPLELRDQILELLSSCHDLHLSCTRLLPPEVWRDMLLGKKFLPFLYDIDDAAVLRCIQETEGKASTNQVDWESLVRSLSRGAWASRDCHGPPPSLDADGWDPETGYYYCDLPAPAGLRNRRRIWQLAEEMFVGDVLPSKRSGASVPRYWDEYGERVYPVVRLSE